MDKNNQRLTQEQITAIVYATKEKNITSENLVKEIEPLLTEYFLGNIKTENRGITYEAYNGQIFKLTVKEIK